jgi:hypothetical protein
MNVVEGNDCCPFLMGINQKFRDLCFETTGTYSGHYFQTFFALKFSEQYP